ncbi:MAG TPA: TIGR04283 family arsenosugar biosynthesis glycosyltransferase [Chthoniobacterales bacterium]|jgi:rSAM/selenodomain-associated transferase 2
MATQQNPEISIVIPVTNEAGALPVCLSHIDREASEIVVVDGGSEDETLRIAEDAKCRVISLMERHRARQMNCGAARARGRILLFLHADTWLPPGALDKIRRAIDDRAALGGGFSRRYRSRSPTLALTSRLAGLRNRLFGWHLGDQAIFVRRDIFEKLDGYCDIPIFEDLDFSRRLRRRGRTVTLSPPVSSSARRFVERGPLRTTWNDLLLTRKYLLGTDPNELCQAPRNRLKALQAYERLS